MVTRFLLVLDVTPASKAARSLVLGVATPNGATVTGLVIVDPQLVTPVEPVSIGGLSYKRHKDDVLIERARKNADELLDEFKKEAEKAGVKAETGVVVGPSATVLADASAIHDVVFTGYDAAYASSANEKTSPFIRSFLHDNPRPVVVVPAGGQVGARAVIAYDGSNSAKRAIQLLAF